MSQTILQTMSQMILLSMPMTTQNAKKSRFISFQQKIKEQHT
jgi:hypothetical protein